jgi:hypothetical protein
MGRPFCFRAVARTGSTRRHAVCLNDVRCRLGISASKCQGLDPDNHRHKLLCQVTVGASRVTHTYPRQTEFSIQLPEAQRRKGKHKLSDTTPTQYEFKFKWHNRKAEFEDQVRSRFPFKLNSRQIVAPLYYNNKTL